MRAAQHVMRWVSRAQVITTKPARACGTHEVCCCLDSDIVAAQKGVFSVCENIFATV
jgi:hypothetical protein